MPEINEPDTRINTRDTSYWKDRISEYGSIRPHYSVWIGDDIDSINRIHKEFIKSNIPAGKEVLDIGCGYGRMSEFMNRYRYVGVDFSQDFIDMANKMYPGKSFVVGDILNGLPFKDQQFEYAISVGMERMMRNARDWEVACIEMKRVAKTILVMDMNITEIPYIL